MSLKVILLGQGLCEFYN